MSLSHDTADEHVPFVDYVVAAIDDRADAEAAASALRASGFAAEDIILSAPASDGQQALEREQGTLAGPTQRGAACPH